MFGLLPSNKPIGNQLYRLACFTLFSIAVFAQAPHVFSATSTELKTAYDQMIEPKLDTSSASNIFRYTISSKDFSFHMDSGQVCFSEPVVLDSVDRVYCAYFSGKGRFKFKPAVDMEKRQLVRFCGSDSLDRSLNKAMIYFGEEIYRRL